MNNFIPEKYERGVWLSLLLSRAVVDLDLKEQGKDYNPEAISRVKDILQTHLDRTQNQRSLDYHLETPMREALGFEVIPKIFGLNPKTSGGYTLEHYQEYLNLILDQFEKLYENNPIRTRFVREFLIDLSNSRIGKLESSARYMAA